MARNWFQQWCSRYAQGLPDGRSRSGRRRWAQRLVIEPLETRAAPVVGSNAAAPVVARGGIYDDVVRLADVGCTGSLLTTRTDILTAAHCVSNTQEHMVFEMVRGGGNIDIPITVPAGFLFQVQHPGYAGIRGGNDLAVMRLTDQEPGFQLPNRHLVAPFPNQGYDLYNQNNEVGQQFTMVGYGLTGTGDLGSQPGTGGVKRSGVNVYGATAALLRNNVQAVRIDGNPTGGTFRLAFNNSFTAPIAWDATAMDVQNALRAVPTIGANVNVTGGRGPNLPFFVQFVNGLASRDVAPLLLAENALTVPAGSGRYATVSVETMVSGTTQAPDTNALVYDFQDPLRPVTSVLNFVYGMNVMAPASGTNSAPGDSGGPGFIGNRISSLVSYGRGFFDTPDVVPGTNSSFGEYSVDTRISPYVNWINGTVGGQPYDLVLDMNQQVLGRDGLHENLTITARRNGANLELVVGGAGDNRLNGTYYSAPAAMINSLTIRGSAGDNHAITIQGDLGIKAITVQGRGGSDSLTINKPRGDNGDTYTVTNNNVFIQNTQTTITYVNMNTLALNTGAGQDIVNVQSTLATTPLTLDGGGGVTDRVTLGNPGGVQDIRGGVDVMNTGGKTTLTVDDAGDPGIRTASLDDISLVGLAPATILFDPTELSALITNGGSGGNFFTVADTPGNPVTTTLNSGTGADVVAVQGTTGPLTVNGQNGLDRVNVGEMGTVGRLRGDLQVTNAGGFTALTVDDSGDAMMRTVSINSGAITGLAPAAIRYDQNGLSALTINGGTANNVFTVANTPSNGLIGVTTTLNNGTGTNTVMVQNTTGALAINGRSRTDQVAVGNAGSLLGIRGPISVTSSGQTALTVDDSADAAGRIVSLSDTGIFGLAPAAIVYGPNDLGALTVKGGKGRNAFVVTNTPPLITTNLIKGPNGDRVDVQASTGPLQISRAAGGPGPGDPDTVNLGLGSTLGILATVTLTNVGGPTVLNVDDSADPVPLTRVTIDAGGITGLAFGPAVIDYSGATLSGLTVSGGFGGNNFTVTNTGGGYTTTLNTGTGIDQVRVLATTGPLTVNGGGGGGLDTLFAGNPTNGVQDIRGRLLITNPSQQFRLYVDDGADTTGRGTADAPVLIDADAITGLAPAAIAYHANDLDYLTVFGGSGDNVFALIRTPATLATTLLTGAGGSEVVNLGTLAGDLGFVGGLVTVVGQGADNTLNLNDQIVSGAAYTFGTTAITGSVQGTFTYGGLQLTYSNVQTVVLNSAGGSVNVQDTLPGMSLTVNIGAGNSAFNIRTTGDGAVVTINAGAGSNSVFIRDTGAGAAVSVDAGGNSAFSVLGTGLGSTVSLTGGSGNSTLTGPDQDTDWDFAGTNAGTLLPGGGSRRTGHLRGDPELPGWDG